MGRPCWMVHFGVGREVADRMSGARLATALAAVLVARLKDMAAGIRAANCLRSPGESGFPDVS